MATKQEVLDLLKGKIKLSDPHNCKGCDHFYSPWTCPNEFVQSQREMFGVWNKNFNPENFWCKDWVEDQGDGYG
jgi:hypothetical protein